MKLLLALFLFFAFVFGKARAEVTVPKTMAENIASYTLHARLDPNAHVLYGDGEISFTNRSVKPQKELWFHLYLNAFKDENSLFFSKGQHDFLAPDQLFTKGRIDLESICIYKKKESKNGENETSCEELKQDLDFHPYSDAFAQDETSIRLPLQNELAVDESITLRVVWRSVFPNIVSRTGFLNRFHMVAQWFPKLAKLERHGEWAHFRYCSLCEFYSDFGTYDVTIDLPKDFTLAATGLENTNQPSPLPLLSPEPGFRRERRVQPNVHDFAFAAWDTFDIREEYMDGIRVRFYYPSRSAKESDGKSYEALMDRLVASLRFAIPYYKELYGSYPYPTLSVVHPPLGAEPAAAMEYPTLITTRGSPSSLPFIHSPEQVITHEFGHQYFYGLIASNEARSPFLDEGLNTFAEHDALSERYGEASGGGLGSFFFPLPISVSESSWSYLWSLPWFQKEPVSTAAFDFYESAHYGPIVYGRSATILETIKRVYGDKIFRSWLKTYALRYRFDQPSEGDFFQLAKEFYGCPDLEKTEFKHQCVAYRNLLLAFTEMGHVDYQIESVEQKIEATGSASPINISNKITLSRTGTLVFPITLRIFFEDDTSKDIELQAFEENHLILFEKNQKHIASVVLDPEHKILVEDNHLNNVYKMMPEPKAASSWSRTQTWVASLFGLLFHIFI